MFQYVLFDLDGTLTDPKEGITKCVQFALRQQGIHEPDLDRLEPFIGPPLKDSFMEFYGMTEEQAALGIADYRKRFAPIGIFENKVYPGVPEMLSRLKEAGMYLAIASSKPENFVLKILEHFELDSYFDVVAGSNLDGSRSTKEEVLDEALRRLRLEAERRTAAGTGGQRVSFNRSNCAMVGDRKFDISGARKYGLTAVGVSYGYAGKGELEEAGADYIAKTVKRLETFLLRGGRTGDGQAENRRAEEAKEAAEAPGEQETTGALTAETQVAGEKETARRPLAYKSRFQKTWHTLFPFLLYYLAYHACYIVVVTLIQIFCRLSPAVCKLEWVHENSLFAAGIVQGCSMLAAAGTLLPLFRREQETDRYGGGKAAPSFYLTVGILSGAMAVGFNILFRLLYLTEISARYSETARAQYRIPFAYGMLLYGLISPLSEELLFRGLIYRRMKRYIPVKWAIPLSALFFGLYHGNLVQTLYGTILGAMIAYVYEVSGDFGISVFAHAAANCAVFLMSYRADVMDAISVPVNCAIFMIISISSLWSIKKRAEN